MELKVLTLNCWGLYMDAKVVKERLLEISKGLNQAVKQYDVVCMQEIWSREDYNDFVTRLSSNLPYSHHFLNCSFTGSGLCIFSKYPISSVISHQFRVSGAVRKFCDGEVFVGKGVLCCKIETPEGTIAVFNTHINPRFRDSQLFELMQFAYHIRADDPVIVCGDFNTKDTHLPYRLMTQCLDLLDVYSDEPDVLTCDLSTNIFTKPKMKGKAKRIDYIFYSDQLIVKSKRLAFSGAIPGKAYPYSDHEGVEAIFKLVKDTECGKRRKKKMNSNALQTLQALAEEISHKQSQHMKGGSLKRGAMFIIGLFLLSVVVCLLLCGLVEMFPEYSLHRAVVPIGILYGVLAMAVFVFSLNENQLNLGLKANVDEIKAILHHQMR